MLIKLEKVSKSYQDFTLDCSLCLEEGRVTGLIGQNGAGKSTAFKAILGLIKPDGGQIQIMGRDLETGETVDRSQFGVALADSSFGDHITVKQAASILDAAYETFQKEAFLQQCQAHNLPMKKKFKEFSTGMKAKLKVLIALSHEAKLLILDEPTAGLDVIARDEILNLLRTYMETEGRGILISSHISSDLESLCDDIYMIHEGKIIFHEETDVILSDYGVLKLEEEQYQALDKEYLLCVKEESYGYSCLTGKRQFYEENYPSIVAEKCGIDQIEMMLIGGVQK